MKTVTSADGTTIAYDEFGTGAPLVCVPPAFGLRSVYEPLAAELSSEYRVIIYDRRGRGDSTDAIKPQDVASYRIEREIEDLAAVIATIDGDSAVLGYSSGARLALEAAAAGVPMIKIALYEPPFRPGAAETFDRVVGKLADQIATGHPGDAVATFQTEAIGIPAEMVDGIRNSPMWTTLEAIAQTVVYDATITAAPGVSESVRQLPQPVAVIAGTETWPTLIESARYVPDMITNASLIEVPGGANHQLDAATTGAALRTFLA